MFIPQNGIFVKNGDGGIGYLTTSILPLQEIMPHYGIFVMIGVGALSCLTTSILTLRKIVPHCGILVRNVDGAYMLSDQFYSAPSGNYAPLWYICHDSGWGLQIIGALLFCPFTKLCPIMVYLSRLGVGAISYWITSILSLCKFMHQYGIFVKNGDGVLVILPILFCSFACLCPKNGIFVKNGDGGIGYLTTSNLPLQEIMPHYGIFVMIGVGALSCLTTSILTLRKIVPHCGILFRNVDGAYMLSDHFFSAPSRV